MPTHARTGVTATDRGIGASVTWVELTSVLSANGLLQSDLLPVAGAPSAVTGVMYVAILISRLVALSLHDKK